MHRTDRNPDLPILGLARLGAGWKCQQCVTHLCLLQDAITLHSAQLLLAEAKCREEQCSWNVQEIQVVNAGPTPLPLCFLQSNRHCHCGLLLSGAVTGRF